jgi:hypothetical protein
VPAAVVVKIFVAGHLVGYVLRTADAIFTIIPSSGPNIKRILFADSADVICELVGARKRSLLAFFKTIRTAAPGDFSVSAPNSCRRLIAVLIYVEAIFAGAIHVKCQVGSVHFESLAIVEVAHAEEQ